MLRIAEGDAVWGEPKGTIGSQETWKMIEEDSIHKTSNNKIFEESGEDQNVLFSPLFNAAVSDLIDDLSIPNHLLRKELAQWIV